MTALLTIALPIIVQFANEDAAWILSVAIMVFFGCAMAILTSAIAGFAGMLPPMYMSAFMLGVALNGVGTLALRAITLVSFDIMNKAKYFVGSLLYFVVNAIFYLICAFGIFPMIKSNVIIFNLANNLEDNRAGDASADKNIIKLINANDTATFNEAVLNCLHYQN